MPSVPSPFSRRGPLAVVIILAIAVLSGVVAWRFQTDLTRARTRVASGGTVISTPCGLIEYQEAGSGISLLAVHGSGGGYDQGMAFAAPLTRRGVRVIAMSRFGYLRTPMSADASADAQADAHICLLNALGIGTAAVLGGSAGAPSALQMAIRHPDRVNALILLAPLAWKPPTQADSVQQIAPWVESLMMAVIGSDFLFWSGTQLSRGVMMDTILATPPALLTSASAAEIERINTMLDDILPVSARAAGLRSDSAVGRHLGPSPLGAVRAPTLIIAARDDGYGTYASAEYTARGIPGSRFLGFDTGGHTWVGHDDDVMDAIAALIIPAKTVAAP